jgi:hypothetical protein
MLMMNESSLREPRAQLATVNKARKGLESTTDEKTLPTTLSD